MRLKVQNESGLYRDTHSRAIVNDDAVGYLRYTKQKQNINRQHQLASEYESRLKQVESDLGDIKCLLSSLLDKLSDR